MYIIVSSFVETCVSIDGVALKGQEFIWVDASGNTADVSSCYYTDTGTHFISDKIPFPGELYAMSIIFTMPIKITKN